jgi:UDP-GlcNAc:undecaprenyl-phosphate GlcNAc-1-phosphate transferase
MMAYLMGATLAFLRYNFNPASIFMGDAGALFLGFILGASTLIQQQKGVAVIALAVPMVVMAIPLLDTYLSFYRRLQRARQGRFFTPDRNHLHHRLLDLGLTQKQVVLSMYYLSACMGLLAFMLSVAPASYGFLILLLAAMAIFFGVLVLRFIEALGQKSRKSAE